MDFSDAISRWTSSFQMNDSASPISLSPTNKNHNFSCIRRWKTKRSSLSHSDIRHKFTFNVAISVLSSFASLWTMHFVVTNAWMNLKPQLNLQWYVYSIVTKTIYFEGMIWTAFFCGRLTLLSFLGCCFFSRLWVSAFTFNAAYSVTEKRLSTQFIFALHTRVFHSLQQHGKKTH